MEVVCLTSKNIFQENTYLIIRESECLVLDPGSSPEILMEELAARDLNPLAVLATHGHPDHIVSARVLCETFHIPFYMHSADRYWLDNFSGFAARFGLTDHGVPVPEDVHDLKDRKEIRIADFKIRIIFTPGHSAGSVCFLLNEILFSGDTLFRGAVGRSDLPGGNGPTLKTSISENLMCLPEHVVVYPGHMDKTTIGYERKNNYFIQD